MMEEQGFVVVPGLLSRREAEEARGELERFRRDILPDMPAKSYVLEDHGGLVRSIYWMNLYDAYFRDLLSHPDIADAARAVVSWEPRPFFVESYWKAPRVGSEIARHQDNIYSSLSPPHELTVWIAMDDSGEENGGVTYYCGSHRAGLLPHCPTRGPRGNMRVSPEVDLRRFEPVVPSLRPGDAVVHTCLTVHGSGPNRSAQPRRGLAVGYRGVEASVDRSVVEDTVRIA